MSEDIKIRVSSETDASGIEKMRREIERLNQEAEKTDRRNAYPQFGMAKRKEALDKSKVLESTVRASGNTGLADSIKAENAAMEIALRLQARHNMGYAEAIKMGRVQVANQIRIKEETAARQALEKGVAASGQSGGSLINHRAQNELLTAGRMIAEGQSPMRALSSAFGQIIPKLGLFGTALATVGAIGIAKVNSYFANREMDESISNQRGAEQRQDRRSNAILRSWRGSAGEASEAAFSAEQQAAQLRDLRPELEHRTKLSIWNPLRWVDALTGLDHRKEDIFGEKTEGQRAIDENEAQIARMEEDAAKKRAIAKEQWETGGSIELDIKRDTALHSLEGMKQKRVHEAVLSWSNEWNRIMKETGFDETGGNDALATESANLKVAEEQRQIGIRQAAGLVNARSGAGDIAAAARIAAGSEMSREIKTSVDQLHVTVLKHSSSMMEGSTRKNYGGDQ